MFLFAEVVTYYNRSRLLHEANNGDTNGVVASNNTGNKISFGQLYNHVLLVYLFKYYVNLRTEYNAIFHR